MVRSFGVFFAGVLAFAFPSQPVSADPNALWHIVHDKCVPHQQAYSTPDPCAEVDLTGGFAVLKDIVGASQYLLIPTARVSGIESPEVLMPDAPNYWQAAWQARRFVDQRLGQELPRSDVSLAVNSVLGRTQEQLHIHVDCVRADVQAALKEHASAIGMNWAPFPIVLAGHSYMTRRLEQTDLRNTNPFLLLADGIPGARDDMAQRTLVIVGVDLAEQKGFVLLTDRADLARGNRASGEQLQDHGCAVVHQAEASGRS